MFQTQSLYLFIQLFIIYILILNLILLINF
jgi:hypothetical protein